MAQQHSGVTTARYAADPFTDELITAEEYEARERVHREKQEALGLEAQTRHSTLVAQTAGVMREVVKVHEPSGINYCCRECRYWPCDTFTTIETYTYGIAALTVELGDRELAETAWALGDRPTRDGA